MPVNHECMNHSRIEERLKNGEEEFADIKKSLDDFRKDMKEIANNFAVEAKELREFTMTMHAEYTKRMADLMLIFNTTINGNGETGHIGHEEKIRKNEADIKLILRSVPIIGVIVTAAITTIAKVFWGRMNDVLIAIDHFNKVIQKP